MIAASSLLRLGSVLLIAGCLLSSCASQPEPPTASAAAPVKRDKAFWIGDQVAGSSRIVIDLSAQRIRYYKGGQLVGLSPISSGREGHSTVRGRFRISQKDRYHRSSLYGAFVDDAGNVVVEDVDVRKDSRPPGTRFLGARMHYFMRVTGAIGMHEGYLPGYPASHGCIRLPTDMAAAFYHATPHGTPVEIVGDASLATYEPPETTTPSGQQPKKAKSFKPTKRHPVPPGTTLYL